MNHSARMVDLMNRLDFVAWDRFIEDTYETTVYGWIDRPGEERKDFVVLTFEVREGDDLTWMHRTSSAEHSREISRRLYGSLDRDSHIDCQRIEDHFGGLIDNVVTRGRVRRLPSTQTPRRAAA